MSPLEGYSRAQTSPRGYGSSYGSAAALAYAQQQSYNVSSPGFLNGMSNLMTSAFSTIGPFGLSSAQYGLGPNK
ncbi:unnamed protein product [Didymodactylos carnosus]|uniref:Uncharacterized protein n=1 Tax=Didymodactylos carnosus TaxID=1234261 RepID=A0A8S2E826_9BILA|nr:unnamed protein product [Didymodactylos carnosus]CAF3958642.1 unnamed protein product [Didymodactylos carnosus]